ncbi:MAG: outer membrane lipoprotein-sorting protein [Myxococcota bacterium]
MKTLPLFVITSLVSSLFLASSALSAPVTESVVTGKVVTEKAAPVQVAAATAPATATPSADELLKKAGDMLFPDQFTAKLSIEAVKPGAPNTVSTMMLYKRGKDSVRAEYLTPAAQAGQRMLRNQGQLYMFMPDTKRPVKLNAKQSLNGGSFNNGDIMNLNFEQDYNASILKDDGNQIVLEMKAKNTSVTYDRVLWTLEKKSLRSVKQEFYTLSGKLIKSLEFQEFKKYGALERPSVFLMKSELASGVYSKMTYLEFTPGKTLAESEFRLDALNRQ